VVKADANENAKKTLEEKVAKQEEELKKLRGGEVMVFVILKFIILYN